MSGGESRECFPEIFDSYAPSVLRFARRRLDDPAHRTISLESTASLNP